MIFLPVAIMMSSAELENLLVEYSKEINQKHKIFFIKMINEIRMYNNIDNLFIYINDEIHKCDCENILTNNINECTCIFFYNRYKFIEKLFKYYKRNLLNLKTKQNKGTIN